MVDCDRPLYSLSPRWPGGEGRVRGANGFGGATHLTLPSLREGPLPLPPEGRRGDFPIARFECPKRCKCTQ